MRVRVSERRVLVGVRRILDAGDPFPTVDALTRGGYAGNRGIASAALRGLERHRLISRTGHGWVTGSLSQMGRNATVHWETQPDRWLPAVKHRPRNKMVRAIEEGRTQYPKQVRFPVNELLRPGVSNTKLGGLITKGKWKGGRIVYLTLEERKTCPRTCAVYDWCYGDNMNMAVRAPHGKELEVRLWEDLEKRARGRGGVPRKADNLLVVRLHELGDFYSVPYVKLWEVLLVRHAWLRVFGYTAWWPGTEIGDEVQRVRSLYPDRFVIRTSGYGETMGAYVVPATATALEGAFLCPEQTDQVATCAECGACWGTEKNVAFRQH